MYVHHKDIHSTVTQQYQPPSDTCIGPDLPGVWYRGWGHVWESVEARSMFMYGSSYARSSLCSLGVFLVTVCIEMN